MNRKEFQQWLDQFPEDTLIQVVEVSSGGYSTTAKMVDFTGDLDQYYLLDFTNDPFVKEDQPYFGKKVLEIGQGES